MANNLVNSIKNLMLEALTKWVRRPFANKLTWFVAGTGALIMVAPRMAATVVNEIAKNNFNIDLQVTNPGPWEYGVGSGLIIFAMVYSGYIHYVNAKLSPHTVRRDISLAVSLLDCSGNPIADGYQFYGKLFSYNGKVPRYTPPADPFSFCLPNSYYHEESLEYLQAHGNALPITVNIKNASLISAKNVVVKLKFEPENMVDLRTYFNMPERPKASHDRFAVQFPEHAAYDGDILISDNVAEFRVDIINPGDAVTSEAEVLLRVTNSGAVTIASSCFAEDLAHPICQWVTINAIMEEKKLPLKHLSHHGIRQYLEETE